MTSTRFLASSSLARYAIPALVIDLEQQVTPLVRVLNASQSLLKSSWSATETHDVRGCSLGKCPSNDSARGYWGPVTANQCSFLGW